MKKVTLLCGLLLALSVSVASAAGVNLRWLACYGDAGVQNRASTCLTNTGTNPLVGSFQLPADVLGVTGIEAIVDLASAGSALPAWWTFNAPGGAVGCKGGALTVNATIAVTAVNCADWAGGAAAGGLAAYQIGNYGPNTARIKIGFAVATPVDVLGAQEYFAFNCNVSNVKTVGTGSCAGCLTPVCISMSSINVVPGTRPGIKLFGATNGTDSNFATWQGGAGVGTTLGNGCPAATPTRNTTWGSVKSLYR